MLEEMSGQSSHLPPFGTPRDRAAVISVNLLLRQYQHKWCSSCSTAKPFSEFISNAARSDGLSAACGRCSREYQKRYDHLSSARHRKSRYGMTEEDYAARIAGQGGRCAICQGCFEKLVVDHDHETGAVRGLLCSSCNTALGQFRDDTKRLHQAIRYLNQHNSRVTE